jgi:hypothetical protein
MSGIGNDSISETSSVDTVPPTTTHNSVPQPDHLTSTFNMFPRNKQDISFIEGRSLNPQTYVKEVELTVSKYTPRNDPNYEELCQQEFARGLSARLAAWYRALVEAGKTWPEIKENFQNVHAVAYPPKHHDFQTEILEFRWTGNESPQRYASRASFINSLAPAKYQPLLPGMLVAGLRRTKHLPKSFYDAFQVKMMFKGYIDPLTNELTETATFDNLCKLLTSLDIDYLPDAYNSLSNQFDLFQPDPELELKQIIQQRQKYDEIDINSYQAKQRQLQLQKELENKLSDPEVDELQAMMNNLTLLIKAKGNDDKKAMEYARLLSSLPSGGTTGLTSVVCRQCGEKGHYARDCRNPKAPDCLNCQMDGHYANQCNMPSFGFGMNPNMPFSNQQHNNFSGRPFNNNFGPNNFNNNNRNGNNGPRNNYNNNGDFNRSSQFNNNYNNNNYPPNNSYNNNNRGYNNNNNYNNNYNGGNWQRNGFGNYQNGPRPYNNNNNNDQPNQSNAPNYNNSSNDNQGSALTPKPEQTPTINNSSAPAQTRCMSVKYPGDDDYEDYYSTFSETERAGAARSQSNNKPTRSTTKTSDDKITKPRGRPPTRQQKPKSVTFETEPASDEEMEDVEVAPSAESTARAPVVRKPLTPISEVRAKRDTMKRNIVGFNEFPAANVDIAEELANVKFSVPFYTAMNSSPMWLKQVLNRLKTERKVGQIPTGTPTTQPIARQVTAGSVKKTQTRARGTLGFVSATINGKNTPRLMWTLLKS